MTQLDNPELYTIGWISALSIERAAAIALLDDRHDAPETFAQHPSDNNSYEWGRIGKHNIVIASLPDGVYGTTSAATTASNLISSLPHIRIGLLVGIGGGIAQPGQDQDIRLGDVVVSQSDGPTGGVVQYDLGKAKLDHWERKGSLHKPPQVLLHALGGLRAKHERQPSEIPNLLQRIYTANPLMTRPKTNYTHQGFGNDHLFPSDYNHVEGNTCDKCDQSREVKRDPRDSTDPEIHYGVIASGNTLVKNASTRDSIFKIAGEQCMCVEMEAAGLMDHFPCLVIRGVCDYADSHKNDRWQRYAAVTAAAYAKELLGFVPTKDLKATPRAIDIPRLRHDIKEVKARTIRIEESLSNVEKRDVHDRLELTNPSPLHNTASGLYEEGTGDWVFRTPEWNSWLSKSSKRCLWIHGIPGSGKTVLISHIINHIENSYTQTTSNENVCSVYYYCYFGRNQNEAAPMLRWVISQLCRKSDVVATSVYALVNRGIEPKLSDLLDALEDALDPFAMVYLAVDALDETIQKTDLLTILFALATEGRFRKLQLLITSREYHHIEEVVKPVSISISMSNEFVTEDIRVYLEIVMRNDRRFSHSRWTSDLLQLILDLVPRKANGMFRWAVCQLDLLRKQRAESLIIRRCLENLPQTLYDTYERIFDSIDREHWPAVQCALRWIYLHQELYASNIPSDIVLQAICHEISGVCSYFYDEDALRDAMGCLVRLTTAEPFKTYPDKLSCPVFSFAHYTVFEFLTSSQLDNSPLQFFKLSPALVCGSISTLLNIAVDPNSYVSMNTNQAFSSNEFKSFTWYSAVSVLFAIATFPHQLITRNDLHPLIWTLLEPTEQHFQRFRELCIWTQDSALIMSEHNLFETSLLAVNWLHLPAAVSRITPFFHLANLQRGHDMSGLVSVFMDKLTIDNLGLENLDLVISADFGEIEERFRFTGSFQTVLAEVHVLLNQLESLTYLIHSFIREEVVDNATLLLLRVCANFTNPIVDEEEDPIFMHLLQRVNPNSMTSGVSALQVAVACCDYRSTRLLLEHGADPNFMSTSCDMVWNEESPLVVFNRLRCQSPLRICRNPDHLFIKLVETLGRDEQIRMRIETLLIENGARSFELTAD